MIWTLVQLLPSFAGPRSHTRCFAHIINLVAKSLLHMFESRHAGDGERDSRDVDADVDVDNLLTQLQDLDVGMPECDDPDDIFDEVRLMSAEEKEIFLEETRAVASALKKVSLYQLYISSTEPAQICTIANKVINSSTILLPQWNAQCHDHNLALRHIPQDVATRWNSTGDMLTFAIQYKRAVRDICDNDALASFCLIGLEWETLENLHDVLQIYFFFFIMGCKLIKMRSQPSKMLPCISLDNLQLLLQ